MRRPPSWRAIRSRWRPAGVPSCWPSITRCSAEMAVHRLKEVCSFWEKLERCQPIKGRIPDGAAKGILRMLPDPELTRRHMHRVAGLGSLGRQRFVALAEWHASHIAREAKAMAPSACWWAAGCKGSSRLLYQEILDTAVRCCDPY